MLEYAIGVVILTASQLILDRHLEERVASVRRLGGAVDRLVLNQGSPVVAINLNACDITDEDLKVLIPFKNLRRLSLSHNPISDNGFDRCTQFGLLTHLDLNSTKITNISAPKIAKLRTLESLYLHSVAIDDTGISHLATLQLKHLVISNSKITNDGLRAISKMSSLRTLGIDSTRVSDEGVKHLHRMRELQWISIANTQVSAAALRQLKLSLPNCVVEH